MKKLCFIFVFLLCFISKTIANAEIYDIDKTVEMCSSKNYLTAGMNKCTLQGIELWNKEIFYYSKQIKKYLSDEELKIFISSEKAWSNYYENEKNFLDFVINDKSGDIHTTFVSSNLYELTKFRAVMLKHYLFQITE